MIGLSPEENDSRHEVTHMFEKRRAIINWLALVLALTASLGLIAGSLPSSVRAGQASPGKPFIGINVPLSGPYAALGKDQVKAYKLAIGRLNEQGGVLGRQLDFEVKDTESDPRLAEKNAQEFIDKRGAVMLTGGSSSAVAIAQSDVCQENGVVFMAALTHSAATTGFERRQGDYGEQKAHRHTFRWYFNAWMTQEALAPFLIQELGSGKNYYYITADYTWGHSLEHAIQYATESAGCNTLGSVRTELGQQSFAREVRQAKEASPDILVLVLFGEDMIKAMQQFHAMGLEKEMHAIVPLIELNMAHTLGPDILQGVVATTNWYWGLQDTYQGSKEFVELYRSRYGKPPGSSAACAWVAVNQWAAAVERCGSFESSRVIKELEDHSFELLKDQETWRSWDHQAVSSVLIVKGKSKGTMVGEWDLLEIVDRVEGSEVVRTRNENPVMLEFLDTE